MSRAPLLGHQPVEAAGPGPGASSWRHGGRTAAVASYDDSWRLSAGSAAAAAAASGASGARRAVPSASAAAYPAWRLNDRHQRKIAVARIDESACVGAHPRVVFCQMTSRELTLEVLQRSYPAGRASWYQSNDGAPMVSPQLVSVEHGGGVAAGGGVSFSGGMGPADESLATSIAASPEAGTSFGGPPGPPSFGPVPAVPAMNTHASAGNLRDAQRRVRSSTAASLLGGLGGSTANLPAGRRIEQLVGSFVRTRDIRLLMTHGAALPEAGGGGEAPGAAAASAAGAAASSLVIVRCGAIVLRLSGFLRCVVVHDGLYLVCDRGGCADAAGVSALAMRLKAVAEEEAAETDADGTTKDQAAAGVRIPAGREPGSAAPDAPDAGARSAQPGGVGREKAGPGPGAGPRTPGRHGPPACLGCVVVGATPDLASAAAAAAAAGWRCAPPSPLHLTPAQDTVADFVTASPGHGDGGGDGAEDGDADPGGSAGLSGVSTPFEAEVETEGTAWGRRTAAGPGGTGAADDGGGGSVDEDAELSAAAAVDAVSPFPMRCLEALFDTLVDELQLRTNALKGEVKDTLETLRHSLGDAFAAGEDSEPFDAVRALRERVRGLAVAVQGAARAVADVLEDDVQMAFMYLKKVHFAPELYEMDPNFRTQHEEVELLLEGYLSQLTAFQAQLESAEYSIDSTEKFVTARLSTQRNELLRLDVTFTVITASVSVSSLITGIFGMNLGSGLESWAQPFPFVLTGAALTVLIGCTTGIMVCRPQLLFSRTFRKSAREGAFGPTRLRLRHMSRGEPDLPEGSPKPAAMYDL